MFYVNTKDNEILSMFFGIASDCLYENYIHWLRKTFTEWSEKNKETNMHSSCKHCLKYLLCSVLILITYWCSRSWKTSRLKTLTLNITISTNYAMILGDNMTTLFPGCRPLECLLDCGGSPTYMKDETGSN